MGNVNVSFFCCLTLQKGKKKIVKKNYQNRKKNCQKLLKIAQKAEKLPC